MNKTKIIIALVSITLILGGYVFITEVVNPFIENKKIEGYNLGVQSIVYEQTTNGIIYYINQDQEIQTIKLQELCGGLV